MSTVVRNLGAIVTLLINYLSHLYKICVFVWLFATKSNFKQCLLSKGLIVLCVFNEAGDLSIHKRIDYCMPN